eukprot:gene30435-36778_t
MAPSSCPDFPESSWPTGYREWRALHVVQEEFRASFGITARFFATRFLGIATPSSFVLQLLYSTGASKNPSMKSGSVGCQIRELLSTFSKDVERLREQEPEIDDSTADEKLEDWSDENIGFLLSKNIRSLALRDEDKKLIIHALDDKAFVKNDIIQLVLSRRSSIAEDVANVLERVEIIEHVRKRFLISRQ